MIIPEGPIYSVVMRGLAAASVDAPSPLAGEAERTAFACSFVMRGLDVRIHPLGEEVRWIAGSSPAMTTGSLGGSL
jgi:hypothetical protein